VRPNRKRLADDRDLPQEKWLVGFRSRSADEEASTSESIFIRQFYASGFYEAYDLVMGHAEKLLLDVVWFKEKRECGSMANNSFPALETLCTYCNKKFNLEEPIPCDADCCSAELCSRSCLEGHHKLKHNIS
jgi:hypothetical protein